MARLVKTYPIKAKWGYVIDTDNGRYVTGYISPLRPPKEHRMYGGENVVIEDTVTIGEIVRGQSAAGVIIYGAINQYYMSVGNMSQTLKACADLDLLCEDGKISGLWTFVKQGSTISLTPYKE